MTGNSTCGKGATGKKPNASAPAKSSAIASNDVPTGRRMNGAEMFMAQSPVAGSSMGFPILYREKRCANRSKYR